MVELINQLDKYRTVAAVTFPTRVAVVQQSATRQQRLHGISGEPRAVTTVDDIMAATASTRATPKSKDADFVKTVIAELASNRHKKSPE